MTEANRRGCGGVRALGRVEEGPIRRDQRDLEIAPMWRRIQKLESRLVEARVASANREDEEESDTTNSSKVGVEGKDDVDDSDPFNGPPIYDVYPNDEADSDFVELSPVYDNYGEVDQEEELEAAILLDDPTILLNPDIDAGVVIGVSPSIIPNLVELGFLRKCIVQSDMKLWPSKIIPGPADKPVIVVDYKDEEKGYDENQKSDELVPDMQDCVYWNVMIAGYAKSGNLVLAVIFFNVMPVKDLVSWNSMLSSCTKNKEMEVALMSFEKMGERDVFSWNSMVDGFIKINDLGRAWDFFERIPERSVVSWVTLLSGCARNGSVSDARKMFDPGPYNVSDSRTNLFIEGENDAVWMRERANGLGEADSSLDGPIRY